MKRIYTILSIVILPFLVCCPTAQATHIRAGDIQAIRTGTLSYQFILTVYTTVGGVINDSNTLHFGDGASQVSAIASSEIIVPGRVQKYTYIFNHTYRALGTYLVWYKGDNRNAGVINIRSSVDNSIYLETQIRIDPGIGINNSPILLAPPIDEAVIGQIFTHNPAAYDIDTYNQNAADSLSYELFPSRQYLETQGPINTTDFVFPHIAAGGLNQAENGNATFTINAVTGDITWDVPRNKVGEYNFAIKVIEWRRNSLGIYRAIGYVVRDMQLKVEDSPNTPTELVIPNDTCVAAGDTLQRIITATDTDLGNRINIESYGAVYELLPATLQAQFTALRNQQSPATGTFYWETQCAAIAVQPYNTVFRAIDTLNVPPSLAAIQSWQVRVLPPAPKNLQVTNLQSGTVTLTWDNYLCTNVKNLILYRKAICGDSVNVCAGQDLTAVGYEKIATLPVSATTFTDDNNGTGLKRGLSYSYRLQAEFEQNRATIKGFVSAEQCVTMPIDIPVLVQVSVLQTDVTNGKMAIKWIQPQNIDTLLYPPPYQYRLVRITPNQANQVIFTTNNLTDATFTDSLLNTKEIQYNYQVVFYYGTLQNLRDSSDAASSVFATTTPLLRSIQLNWQANTPWSNNQQFHYVYREIEGNFTLIDSVLVGNNFSYIDNGSFNNLPLEDGQEYCYYVTTKGTYGNPAIVSPLLNNSQIACGRILDTIPPCEPVFQVGLKLNNLDCITCELYATNDFTNALQWQPTLTQDCDSNVVQYRIYFADNAIAEPQLIATVSDTFFVHTISRSVAGCYQIAAVDVVGNESAKSVKICNDNCSPYTLPNVITPNEDVEKQNELFRPFCIYQPFVREVRFTVYNRWGKKVYFSDNDILINWKGVGQDGVSLPAGTYYYYAEVFSKRLNPENEKQVLKGWIQILR